MPAETPSKTRYPELGYVRDGASLWRIVDMTWRKDDGLFSRVGPHYVTRGELLADLNRYATFFGCDGTTPE